MQFDQPQLLLRIDAGKDIGLEEARAAACSGELRSDVLTRDRGHLAPRQIDGLGDRDRCRHLVAGHHDDSNARSVATGQRRADIAARRIAQRDQTHQLEVPVGFGVDRRDVLLGQCQNAKALRR